MPGLGPADRASEELDGQDGAEHEHPHAAELLGVPYSPLPVQIRAGADELSDWIDGRESRGTSGRTAPVFNPATGAQTGEVDLASSAEVDAVVAQASAAAREWRQSSLSRRSAVLFAFRELLHQRTDELAAIITAEPACFTIDR